MSFFHGHVLYIKSCFMRAFGRPLELPSLRDRFHLGSKQPEKEMTKSNIIPAMALALGSSTGREKSREMSPLIVEKKAMEAIAKELKPMEPKPPNKPYKEIVRGFDHSKNTKQSTEKPTVVQKPQQVLETAPFELLDFEKTEILAFEIVYFYGTIAVKTREGAAGNDGFDDENGDYIANLHDHIAYRYEILGHLGKGSFGQVLKCLDRLTKVIVAVKIVRNKQKFQEQSIVEAQLLQHMKNADPMNKGNIIRLNESFNFRNHLCMNFELLSINLYEHLRLEQFRGLPVTLIKKMAVEILTALVFLKSQKIVHCDLKPENILLKKAKSHQIALIDFGSSCFENATFFTYIQSRFYRAPEVILGLPYGHPIDMWSFACIIGELFTGYPIFPGENEAEQLACIMEVMDVPPKIMVETCKRRKNFFDDAGEPSHTINSRGRKRRPKSRELRALLKSPDSKMVDFIFKCLTWDPTIRLEPSEALNHEWLAEAKPPPEMKPVRPPRGSVSSRLRLSQRSERERKEVLTEIGPLSKIQGKEPPI
ncbi:dual specificity tyrosine-phosphorylation-regulated kinase 4 [Thraustotheca clavata]|uniref:dual-specificity kinase n=1 Tax=Thraustotheca clavata TaxID=74557 RepID=A0A1W0AB14_9STRA|nr:dual specificity tyrosine-phosphorylation-regulated kinase 4 [Thraustotheca clavata]